MSCTYHREPFEITGIVSRVRPYKPPFERNLFKGAVKVSWFTLVKVKSGTLTFAVYEFQERGKPSTRTKLISGRLPKVGEAVRLKYVMISKSNRMRGCITELEIF